jgi:multidrug efflux system membrane fusion protein
MDTKSPAHHLDAVAHGFPDLVRRVEPRTRLILGAVAVVGAVALVWYFLSGTTTKSPASAPPVHVAKAIVKDVDVVEQTIGTVVPVATVNVVPQVTGQLVAAPFQEGQIVHKGDLLFQIDPRPFQAALEQAQAALAKDQATLVSARNDERRYTALFAQNAGSAQQRDTAVATAKADAAIVQSDKAAIDVARINLGYTQIRSPITGKTGAILIQPGNLVTASGSNPLVTITQLQPIKVSLFLPQNDLPQIQQQVAAQALKAVIPMPGARGGNETAPVNFVGNVVSAQTGTIELRATFSNDDFRLVPGQMLSVGVTLRKLDRATVVTRDAVNAGPDGNYVFVVGSDSVARMVPVKVLYDNGAEDAIQGAVKPGDTTIVEGQLRVLPGTKVSVSAQPAPASAPPQPLGAQ